MKRLGSLVVILMILFSIPLSFGATTTLVNDANNLDDGIFTNAVGNAHNANSVIVQIPGTGQFNTTSLTAPNGTIITVSNETTLQRALNRGLINTQWKSPGYRNDTIYYMGSVQPGNVFVGIGTPDPKARLDVNGGIRVGWAPDDVCAAQFKGTIRYNYTSNSLQFCNSTTWTNVAIPGGSTQAPPMISLDDYNQIRIEQYINTVGLCFNGDCRDSWAQISGASQTGSSNITGTMTAGYILRAFNDSGIVNSALYQTSANNVGVGTTALGEKLTVAGNFSTTTGAFLATSSGSVGIGTNNPQQKLDVYAGSITTRSNDGPATMGSGVIIGAEAANTPYIGFRVSDVSQRFKINMSDVNLASERLSISSICGGSCSSTEWFTILKTGYVGIGTTNASSKLHVNGSTYTATTLTEMYNSPVFRINPRSDSTNAIVVAATTAGAGIQSASSTAAATPLILNPFGGYVGVNMGAAAPSYALDVNNSNDQQIRVLSPDSYAGILFQDANGNEPITYRGSTSTFAIGGSGSTVANKKLHVDGGVTIGANYDATAVSANSLLVEGTISRAGNTVWDAANDGAGSGLDADLLDGISSAGFDQSNSNEIQTLGTSGNTITLTSGGSVTAPYATNAGTATNLNGGTVTAAGTFYDAFTHGQYAVLMMPTANNGGGTGDAGLYSWVSEPGVTWTGAGIARNKRNSASGFPRVNTGLSGQMIRFDEGTSIIFTTETSGGVAYTPLTLTSNDATFGGTVTAGSSFNIGNTVLSTNRLYMTSGTNMHVDAATTGGVYLNYYSGTGGVQFCNGVNGCSASVSAAGAFSGAGTGLTGTAASLSIGGNAATATTLSGDRTNWASLRTSAVANLIGWKNYGNNHVIFDASASTSPDGTAISNTNAQVAWSGTYPTLMGWNGANTYGVRVDSARIADTASALAANGANCAAGSYPLGVDASGNVESCTVVSAGGVTSISTSAGTCSGGACNLLSYDGAGSGLDADLLDGISSASFGQFNTWQNNHYSGTDGAEYAVIFYDTNNAGYYVDPSATSNVNQINFGTLCLSGSGCISQITEGYGIQLDGDGSHPTQIRSSALLLGDAVGAGYTAGAVYASYFYYNSDARLKKNIHSYGGAGALDSIMKLKPVTYEWINATHGQEGKQYGFIAQDMQQVFPELVDGAKDNRTLTINYPALVAPLTSAVQEQQKQIEDLRATVDSQQDLINKLSARLDALEAKN